ncbi:MAG: hypothetical protein IJ459_02125 [Clostridia bacterium]|nr:hypothetical protein [Clostridia bacterium]
MAKINVDFSKRQEKIKPVHGVGQPPFVGMKFDTFKYLTDAHIPYSRLHDVQGFYGDFRFVDVPNIFRDFSADESDPASYDFAFTDPLITALIQAGVEPYFRLGVTIEPYQNIKAYRIYPPEDFEKWARICEHIIRHYTEGWADGFNYKITYWEIWNEPDNIKMWLGTPEEFYEFYTVSAKHLKACFPHLKIGGYGSMGFRAGSEYWMNYEGGAYQQKYLGWYNFCEGFLTYVKEHSAPLDFLSWHMYEHDISEVEGRAHDARRILDKYGFYDTETSCNEWNLAVDKRGTFEHAALNTAALIVFQNSPVDNAEFYDARLGISKYGSFFNPMTAKPYPAYYGFTAFGRLYALGDRVEARSDDGGIYVLAAGSDSRGEVLIVNPTGESVPLELSANGEPFVALMTGNGREDGACPIPELIPPHSVISVMYTL